MRRVAVMLALAALLVGCATPDPKAIVRDCGPLCACLHCAWAGTACASGAAP